MPAGVKKVKSGSMPSHATAPAAPPPAIEEISLKDLPEFVDRAKPSGDFRDFVLDLTEAGQIKAGKIIEEAALAGNRKAKRQKTDNPTTICLLCVDSGTPLEGCFFHHKGNGGNKKKHFKNVHVEKKQLVDGEGYVFKRITELKGKLIGKADRVPPPPAPRFGGSGYAMPETTSADLERAVAIWICSTGQTAESVENPLFRKVLNVAAGIRSASSLTMSKEVLGNKIVEVGDKLRNAMKKRAANLQPHRLHLLVGKDMETKQTRACVTFISDEEPTQLELNILPLPVSVDASDRMAAITQALKKVDGSLDVSALAGAKNADSTEEYSFEVPARVSVERISSGKQWDDFDKSKNHGCLDRLVNQVILTSLGMIPEEGEKVGTVPDAVVQAMKPIAGAQWTVVYGRMTEVLLDPDVQNQKKLYSEVHAIIEPLAYLTQIMTANASKPSGPATLVAIALLLNRYGVEFPNGLLNPESIKPKEDAALKELKFDLMDIKNVAGSRKVVALKDFSPAGFSFYRGFLANLIHRLSTKRGNRNCYEVLGLMVDPVMVKYGELVFGKGSGEWNYPAIQTHVASCVARFDTGPSPSTATVSADAISDDSLPVPTDTTMLKEFVEVFEKYNPLECWSMADMQTRYPALFRINLVTLAYCANAGVVDPTLSKKRMIESSNLRQAAFVIRQASKNQLENV